MSAQTYYPHKINFQQVYLENKCTGHAKGGRFCKLFYGQTPKLTIQTPKLKAPAGIMVFDDDKGGKKFSLLLSMQPDPSAPAAEQALVDQFHSFWQQLDESIINSVLSHLQADSATPDSWLDVYKKKYSRELFQEGFFRPFCKQGVNRKTNQLYPPSISIKMNPYRNKDRQETFATRFYVPVEAEQKGEGVEDLVLYDENGDVIAKTPETIQQFLPPHSSIKAILDIDGVWIVDKKVSLSVKLSACVVYRPQEVSGPRVLPEPMQEEEPTYYQASSAAAEPAVSDMDEATAHSSVPVALAPAPTTEAKRPRGKK